MPIVRRDEETGALLFRRTKQEKQQDDLKKAYEEQLAKNEDLAQKYNDLSVKMEALTKSLSPKEG